MRSPFGRVPSPDFAAHSTPAARAQDRAAQPRAWILHGSEQDQVVAMDQLVAAAIAEQGLDLLRPVAADPAGVVGIVGAQALGDVVAVGVARSPHRRARTRPRQRRRRPAAGCCRGGAPAPRRRRSAAPPSRRARPRSTPCGRGGDWRGQRSACRARPRRAAPAASLKARRDDHRAAGAWRSGRPRAC